MLWFRIVWYYWEMETKAQSLWDRQSESETLWPEELVRGGVDLWALFTLMYITWESFFITFTYFYLQLWVYLLCTSASLEGWVFILYKVTDSFSSYSGYFFFISMVFFLSWLVKNVFIAVIIETFAEIRVQFRQMYQAKSANSGFMTSKVRHCYIFLFTMECAVIIYSRYHKQFFHVLFCVDMS